MRVLRIRTKQLDKGTQRVFTRAFVLGVTPLRPPEGVQIPPTRESSEKRAALRSPAESLYLLVGAAKTPPWNRTAGNRKEGPIELQGWPQPFGRWSESSERGDANEILTSDRVEKKSELLVYR